jgi:hypothetical protein
MYKSIEEQRVELPINENKYLPSRYEYETKILNNI